MISCVNSITYDQTFTAYQKRGYEFCILMASKKEVRPWLLTKYCNCLYGKNERSKFDFVISGGEWFANEEVFIIDTIRVKKNLNLPFQNNLFNIILHRINDGAYIYGYFDEYYINTKRTYQKDHYKHSFLIYGYNNVSKLFNAIGYTKHNKFEEYNISFEEFMIALTDLPKIELTFVCLNPNYTYEAKIENIYYGLYDYMHSIYSAGSYEPNVVYGIDTLAEFSKYVLHMAENNNNLDLRYSKFFMEFKQFMLERLDFLNNSGYISYGYEEYSEIFQVFQSVHMLFIKYNITCDSTIPLRISKMVEDATCKERKILSRVLSELKKTLMEQNYHNYI